MERRALLQLVSLGLATLPLPAIAAESEDAAFKRKWNEEHPLEYVQLRIGEFGVDRAWRLTEVPLAHMFDLVEVCNEPVVRVHMNARDYADLRKFARDIFDEVETNAESLRTGRQGQAWFADFYTSRLVPVGTVFLVTPHFTEDLTPGFAFPASPNGEPRLWVPPSLSE